MSAHLRDILRPQCRTCHRRATVSLYNACNTHVGDYCLACGKRALKAHRDFEQAPSWRNLKVLLERNEV